MSVDLALRFVEERNTTRKVSPGPRPEGIRLQSSGTSGLVLALATLEAAPVPAELMAETR